MSTPSLISKNPVSSIRLNFATKLSVGVAATARELNLYESQLYAWRSNQQQKMTSPERESGLVAENVCLKRQLAEQAHCWSKVFWNVCEAPGQHLPSRTDC